MLFGQANRALVRATMEERSDTIFFSRFYALPKRRVLFVTRYENSFILKIFSIDNLHLPLAEKTINSYTFKLLGIFPNGSLLCREGGLECNLIQIDIETMERCLIQPWHCVTSFIGIIDDTSFFEIRKPDKHWRKTGEEYWLFIYKYTVTGYVETRKIKLANQPDHSNNPIQSLKNNCYSYRINKSKKNEFRTLVFKLNAEKSEMQELGIIASEVLTSRLHYYEDREADKSGQAVALQNGQLLTYHKNRRRAQIWDTISFECIKEWDWTNIAETIDLSAGPLKIFPFPDSLHLLIKQDESLFVFNTDMLTMKKIRFWYKANFFDNLHILPNGQVLGFVEKKRDSIQAKLFDLKETLVYQKVLGDYTISQRLWRYHLNYNKALPEELTEYILSYAFKSEEKEKALKKAYDDMDNDQRPSCLTM